MGGPWPPQGGACLELLLQGGGHECPMQMRGGKGAGAIALQTPLCSGEGSIKQQQKHHPPGDCGLHPLPSLRSVTASHTSPAALYGFHEAPRHSWGHVMACKGQRCAHLGISLSQLLIPPEGGRGRHGACFQGWMALPWPCQQAVALPRLQLCPLGA